MQSLLCTKCKKPFEGEDLDKVCQCQEESKDPSFFRLLEIMAEYNKKLDKL